MILSLVAAPIGVAGTSGSAVPTTERIAAQSDDPTPVVESVNANEIATANDAIDSFNAQLQSKADILDIEVANVSAIDEVRAETIPEAHDEADRLRADADDREAAIFDRVVEVITKADIADVGDDEVQSPADARALADELEGQGVLPDQAAESLRDAADLVENDLEPPLNGAADKLDALEAGPEVGTVDGTVTDADGNAIAGATVTVGNETATTDANGTYAVELEPGEYTFEVSADGYESASQTITVEAGATTTVNATLQPNESGGSDSVAEVVESVNANEIAAANDAIDSFNSQLQSKADILGIDVANVSNVDEVQAETVPEAHDEADRLRADADDREAAIFNRIVEVINKGDIADVSKDEVQSPADARALADELEGQGVLADQAAESLRDAADLVETDLKPPLNDGADELDQLEGDSPPVDKVVEEVNANEIAAANDAIDSFNAQLQSKADILDIDVANVSAVDEVQAETVPEARDEADRLRADADDREAAIFNRVVEVINKADIANVSKDEVQSPADARALADELEGQGVLPDQAAQSLRDAADLVENDLRPPLNTAADKLEGFGPEPEVGTVDGTVTAADGVAIANATVSVGNETVTTDANGTYAVELEPGEYELAVSADGYESASQNVTVEAGTTTTVDVTLEEATGTVEGTVTDVDGEPIAGATVAVGDQQTTTGADGGYAVELTPGEYTLAISADGYEGTSETVVIEADATTTVDVTLEAADGAIEGTVTDTTGEPIADATVAVDGQQTTTAADGSYAVEVEAGDYTLSVSAAGYVAASEDVTVAPGETATVDVTLEEATGSVEGTVTDADGNAVAGATVAVGDQETITAADGSFAVDLSPGEYTLSVSAEGYEDASQDVTVEADTTTTVDVTLEPVTGTVEGTVTDAAGEPIANATVTADESVTPAAVDGDQQTTTDANGTYALELEAGDYTVTVSADGYEDASQDVTVEADTTTTVDITLEPADGTVAGTVTDADGNAVADATVTVGDQQTTTAADGSYSVALEPGEYVLAVSADGYEDASENVTVDAGETTTVDVTLRESDGTIEGTVTDAGGSAVADATVTVGAQQTTTDENGTYAIDLEPGEYTLEVTAQGYESASQNVTVEAGATTTVDVTLEAVPTTGTLEGTVSDAAGEPIADATVAVGAQQTTTDANGTYSLELEAGDYTVAVSAEGYEDASRNVTVEAGATTTVDVSLEADVTDPIAEVVESVNANEIAETNDAIEAFNEKIDEQAPDDQAQTQADAEQFDDVELVEPVEATTDAEAAAEAQRLREDADERQEAIFNTLVEVINARAPDIVSPILDEDDVTTPAEARAEGKRIEEEYGDIDDDAELANESLHNAADLVEFTVQPNLNGAADKLENVSDPEPTLGTLEGTVSDAAGEPIADATVAVGDQQTRTDENGSFALEVESGEYTLTVSAEGYEDASRNVTVEAGTTTTVDITLTEVPVEPEPDADVVVDATVDKERVAVGETVTVDVTIENATGDAETEFFHDDETRVGAYTLVLRYDSDSLEFTGIDRPHWQVVDIENDGILVVDRAWVPPGRNEMPVDAFTAEFEVVDGAGDDAAFEFDPTASSVEERVFLWKTQPLEATYDGASVAVEAPDEGDNEAPNPEPTPEPNPEPTPEPKPEPNPNPVEYPDSISVIWDAIIGFGSEFVGIDSSASPIGGGHGFAPIR